MKSPAIASLTEQFIADLELIIVARKAQLVTAALGRVEPLARPVAKVLPFARPRKKAPIQLCPTPGCANRAAPVFHMLCASHKDTPKATVAKWRAARRAAQDGRSRG